MNTNAPPGTMRYNYEKNQLEWFSGAGWDRVSEDMSPGAMVYLHGKRSDLLVAEGQAIRSLLSKIKEEHPHALVSCPHTPHTSQLRQQTPWLFDTLELDMCDACLDALFMTGDEDKWR